MRAYSIRPSEILASLWHHRDLILASVRREVLGRYRGSFMGILWSFFNPLFMLAVYTFVFGVIFKARWNLENDSRSEFALVLFAGMMMFNLFSECINRAPSLILSNPSYVKKIVYPLEVLPWISLGSALFHFFVSLAVWLIAYAFVFGVPPVTALLLPAILVPFLLLIMGLSWLFASLGVFLRDVSQVIGIVTTALMFLSPIFYPVTALPEKYRPLIFWNPLTPAVELTRDILFWGTKPNMPLLGLYLIGSATVAWLGFVWFQKTRKGFADVL